jgi:hypothetical protein
MDVGFEVMTNSPAEFILSEQPSPLEVEAGNT